MTRLLLLGAVLLLPLDVWASEFDLTRQPRITLGCVDGFIDDPIKHQCVPYPDPCLATMEAAMREMEPYLPLEVSIEVQQWVMRVLRQKTTENNAALSREGEVRAKKYAAVGETFYKAKRCWTNQPQGGK